MRHKSHKQRTHKRKPFSRTRKVQRQQKQHGGDPLADFLKAHNFELLEVPPDGNCFFYSLDAFFKLTGHPLMGQDHSDLRATVVAHMLANKEKFLPFVAKEYAFKNEARRKKFLESYVEKQIRALGADNAWASELGDIIPQEAPNAFRVKINIYNWDNDEATLFTFVPDGVAVNNAALPTINLLRINDNHFELLMDKPTFDADKEMQDRWAVIKAIHTGTNSSLHLSAN